MASKTKMLTQQQQMLIKIILFNAYMIKQNRGLKKKKYVTEQYNTSAQSENGSTIAYPLNGSVQDSTEFSPTCAGLTSLYKTNFQSPFYLFFLKQLLCFPEKQIYLFIIFVQLVLNSFKYTVLLSFMHQLFNRSLDCQELNF